MRQNTKSLGDVGLYNVIGCLGKYGIGIATLLSDNYPFDLVGICNNNLFKIQIKSSSEVRNNESVGFSFLSNNFRRGEVTRYTKEEVDVFACYDLINNKVFLLKFDEMNGRSHITFRYLKCKNNNEKLIHWSDDYIISEKRIKEVFDYDVPNFKTLYSNGLGEKKIHPHLCAVCGKDFLSQDKYAKHCSIQCKSFAHRHVERPSKEELTELLKTMSFVQIGKKFGVSDNSVRKWVKYYHKNEH